ncbi:hypothetical protein BU14_0393s0019 [Porphyra umbilicalis]|uniref:PWWP domain-containing protein n=1 Tax=Porphyra umbilicalis TaxID=2786 RepID=A0A1X6NWD4_PORUM|nr:hypothetical protein BU14_0393s0019 [Porphyra umbilicalis]|eukprot:OSX72931.1 hypothetical protein BU14_0393s0019 [Porphyra umbilicalis]
MGGPATTNLPVDTIVWAKVPGFPWWPARVAETPRNHVKKGVKHTWVLFFNDVNNAWVHPKNLVLLNEEDKEQFLVKPNHKSRPAIDQALRMALEELAESPHPPSFEVVPETKATPVKSKSAYTTPASSKTMARGSKRRSSSSTAAKPSKRKRLQSPDDMEESDAAGDADFAGEAVQNDPDHVEEGGEEAAAAESGSAQDADDAKDVDARLAAAAKVDAEVDAEIEEAHSKAAEKSGSSRRSKRSSGALLTPVTTPKPPKAPKSSKVGKALKSTSGSKRSVKKETRGDSAAPSDGVPADDEPPVPLRKRKSRGSEPLGTPGATTPGPSGHAGLSGDLSDVVPHRSGGGDPAHSRFAAGDEAEDEPDRADSEDGAPSLELAFKFMRIATAKILDDGTDLERSSVVADVADWDKMHKRTNVEELAAGVRAIDEAGTKLGAAIEVLATARTSLQAASDKLQPDKFGTGCLKEYEEAYAAYVEAARGRVSAEEAVALAVRAVIAAKVTVGMLKHSQAGKPVRRLFKRYRATSKPVDFLCSMLITQWMGIIESSQRESKSPSSDKEHAKGATDEKPSKSRESQSPKSRKDKGALADGDMGDGGSSSAAKADPSDAPVGSSKDDAAKAEAKDGAKDGNGVADSPDLGKDQDDVDEKAEVDSAAGDAHDTAGSKAGADAADDNDDADDAADKPASEVEKASDEVDKAGADAADDDAMDTSGTPAKGSADAVPSEKAGIDSVKATGKKAKLSEAAEASPSSPGGMEVDGGGDEKAEAGDASDGDDGDDVKAAASKDSDAADAADAVKDSGDDDGAKKAESDMDRDE